MDCAAVAVVSGGTAYHMVDSDSLTSLRSMCTSTTTVLLYNYYCILQLQAWQTIVCGERAHQVSSFPPPFPPPGCSNDIAVASSVLLEHHETPDPSGMSFFAETIPTTCCTIVILLNSKWATYISYVTAGDLNELPVDSSWITCVVLTVFFGNWTGRHTLI